MPRASCSRRPAGPWATSRPTRVRCSRRSAFAIKAGAITSKTIPSADFAVLADVDAKVLAEYVAKTEQKQGKKPDACKDYRKVLDRKDIDAVMIATPRPLAYEDRRRGDARRQGTSTVKKPLTLTIDEGKLIEKVVQKTGRVFQVGTMQRTEINQRFLLAIALVKNGRIGTRPAGHLRHQRHEAFAVDSRGAGSRGTRLGFLARPGPPRVDYRALPEMRKGYGGGVPLYSNCHYSFRDWHEYSGGKLTDWGAHHVDIACWALGATATGPSKLTPLEFALGCEYKNGYPTVHDRFNVATEFTLRADMPGGVELIITSKGDNGLLFEGTKGRFFVNRGKIAGAPVEELKSNPLPEGALEKIYGGPIPKNHSVKLHRVDAVAQAADLRRLVAQPDAGNLPPFEHRDAIGPNAELGSRQTCDHGRRRSQRLPRPRIPQGI